MADKKKKKIKKDSLAECKIKSLGYLSAIEHHVAELKKIIAES